MTNLLERITTFLEGLSERERRLATAVLALLPLFIFLVIGRAALSHVQALDAHIDGLSDRIVEYTGQIARKQSVDTQFAEIAAQHSSSWSEAEIQGRLRMELYRLAEKLPPPLTPDGTPAATENRAFGQLVKTPELGAGALRDSGEGYKEYYLSVNVPTSEFYDAIAYLERLQGSPQMLRIENMILKRTPSTTEVTLDLDIVRTVVVGTTPGAAALDSERIFFDGTPIDWQLSAWKSEQCATALANTPLTTGQETLEVLAAAPNGTVHLEQIVAAGKLYNFVADIKSDGPSRLAIQADGADDIFDGEKLLPANGKPYRYHLQFVAPGAPGEQVKLKLPFITLEKAGAKVYIENLLLQAAEE